MKCAWNQWEFAFPIKSYPIAQGQIEREPVQTVGIDSEAYIDGKPFLWCFSDGLSCTPSDFYATLFRHEYQHKIFVCFNLHYEEGAIFYPLDNAQLAELRLKGKTKYDKYVISNIPNKEVVIRWRNRTIRIYDIAPYYHSSLQRAAMDYLGESKNEIENKAFTPDNILPRFTEIVAYCVKDARLTKQLADLFLATLSGVNLFPKKLISTGYISAKHFRTIHNSSIRSFYERYPEATRFAWESYAGGKFEVYKRGFANFYEYDINSAYPSTIANLYDLAGCRCFQDIHYQASADYGFLYCDLNIQGDYSPVPVKIGTLNTYPVGHFKAYIGKSTYEWLIYHGQHVKILDAWWIYTNHVQPYKEEVDRLYRLKAECKGIDSMKYLLIKILLNSLYGKFAAITPIYKEKDNRIHYYLGDLHNPIYASVITEDCRLKVCEVCKQWGDSVCAVHTDSVIAFEPLKITCDKLLGGWSLAEQGNGVIIGSGIYEIGDKNAIRGFHLKKEKLPDGTEHQITIKELLENSKGPKIKIKHLVVKSWRQTLIQHTNETNKFIEDDAKILDLNFDRKRIWHHRFSRRKQLQNSEPLFVNL